MTWHPSPAETRLDAEDMMARLHQLRRLLDANAIGVAEYKEVESNCLQQDF